ncbi:MAG: ComF family protein [Patescibacteria group bacterium]
MKKILTWILDWIFPRFCIFCLREGSLLCVNCRPKLEPVAVQVCPGCERVNQKGMVCHDCRAKWGIDSLQVCFRSNICMRRLVHLYKYQNMYDLDEPIVDMIVGLDLAKEKFDLVMAVPLTKKRQRWRGYNQSERLARLVAKRRDLFYFDCLARRHDRVPQVKLGRVERKGNVRGVFVLKLEPKSILGKKILIVDDVCTTGSTLNECAQVLKKAGAKGVSGLVLARGV